MKMIYVKWRDACSQEGWITDGEIKKDCIMETVGIFINDDKDIITVAQNRIEDKGDKDEYQYLMHIPKAFVIEKKLYIRRIPEG